MRFCSIEGCEKKSRSLGYCKTHYWRVRTHGDPNFMLKTPYGEALDFFYEAIKLETDDCIEWPYNKQNGYGAVRYKGKMTKVHRLALILTTGEAPEDKPNALHAPDVCHNPSCFNPRHLRWGDRFDNMADKVLDGTSNRGERCGNSKLTEAQVLEIRADNRLQRIIAEEYGIERTNVSQIKTRKTWNHI